MAAAFQAARAATVDPLLVAANRSAVVRLVVSNLFGQNAPAIAAVEGQYEQMWAADVAAMAGYHSGASAVAAQLVPWQGSLRGVSGLLGGAPAAAAFPSINLGLGNIGSFNLDGGNQGDANLGSGNVGNFRTRKHRRHQSGQRQQGRYQPGQRQRRQPQSGQRKPW